MKTNYIAATALAAAIALSGAALGPKLVSAADPMGPPAAGDAGPRSDGWQSGFRHHKGHRGGGGGPMGMHRFMAGEHIDGKLAFLKAELKIQPSQEKAWSAFDAAVRKSAKGLQAKHDAMKNQKHWPELTTPERFDKMESMMSTRLEALRSVKGETSALYTALSADQKKTADELFAGPMRPL